MGTPKKETFEHVSEDPVRKVTRSMASKWVPEILDQFKGQGHDQGQESCEGHDQGQECYPSLPSPTHESNDRNAMKRNARNAEDPKKENKKLIIKKPRLDPILEDDKTVCLKINNCNY